MAWLRIRVLMRREGCPINHKKAYRIYCEEGWNLRRRRAKRRVAATHRESRPAATVFNEAWSMDFAADELFSGRRIRSLTVVDIFSREALAITVDQSLKGDAVVDTMKLIEQMRGLPQRIKVDHGSEFISKGLNKWAYNNGVQLDFSRHGKPRNIPFIESFDGSCREKNV